jgi:HEPN domain-containing protein
MSDQPKRPVETPREWLRYAEGDLLVARWAFQDKVPAYHTICFLCQSAAEKFLKGYLIAQGWTLQKIHDIVALLELCAEYDPAWTDLAADGVILNEYIIAGRYPGDIALEGIGRPEAEEALEAAHRIATHARNLIMGDSAQG